MAPFLAHPVERELFYIALFYIRYIPAVKVNFRPAAIAQEQSRPSSVQSASDEQQIAITMMYTVHNRITNRISVVTY